MHERPRGGALTFLLVPDVAHEALPAIPRLRELIARLARRLVPQVTLFHLLVQLAHGQAAGAFYLFGIRFMRHDRVSA